MLGARPGARPGAIPGAILESREPHNAVVALPRAGVPADHGLATLGLVMQLAGRTSGALAALIASVVVIESRIHRNAA